MDALARWKFNETDVVRVEVPQVPAMESNPNWRKGKNVAFNKRQAGKVYASAVFYSAVDWRNKHTEFKPWERARLDLIFIYATSYRRDMDNLIAAFKGGLDALVSAGLLVDDDADHLVWGGMSVLIDKDRAPLTIVEVRQA